MTRAARLWTSCLLATSFCLPLLVGSADTGMVGDPGPIAEEGPPLSILEQYQQFRRERMSPTDLPGATGSAQHPSQYGPQRNDPDLGIPQHAYSPFDPATNAQSHCPSNGCDYAPDAVLIKLKPEVSVAAATGTLQGAALSLDEPGIVSEPDLAQTLWDQGFDALEPLFPGATPPAAGAMATQSDGVQVKLPDLTRWYRVKTAPAAQTAGASAATTTDPLDIPALVKELNATPGVELAEPDYVRKPIGALTPATATATPTGEAGITADDEMNFSDPLFGKQWHLSAANVKKAWHYLDQQGKPAGGSPDVVVAVIDTGVDYTHPDLAANMWKNMPEFYGQAGKDDDGNGYIDDIYGARVVANVSGDPMDDHGHGTHVAGIIGAQAGNNIGGVGVAPGVKLMAIKAAQYSGVLNASDIAKGIYYAVQKGADVINMSFGGYARSILEEDALTVAFGSAVLVAAAGNNETVNLPCDFGANFYPAAYNWVLGVMAHTERPDQQGDYLAKFSNYDCFPNDAQEYEIMAPGIEITSTLPHEGYYPWSGTSMATPVVAGIAALARTQWPDKQTHSSRFIMGQIASTAPLMQAYTPLDPDKEPVYYPSADALAALREVPTPALSYLEHWLFDTTSVAPNNDSDGIVDAGETVDLAIVIRNQWGKAEDVTVKLEAWAAGAVAADPYVILDIDEVNYGAVGSFSNDDNGLIRDAEGAVNGVSAPFRFHTLASTPNDHLIPFKLTITANNGYDPSQSSVTTVSRFYLLVQRGRELPRIINQDMTLTNDFLWLVPDATLIESGVNVTVTEGTQIQFWSTDPSDPYSVSHDAYLQVEGALRIEGNALEPVELFPGHLYPSRAVTIKGGSYTSLQYVKAYNAYIVADEVNHGYFSTDYYGNLYIDKIINSIIKGLGYHETRYPRYIYSSLFDISRKFQIGSTYDPGRFLPHTQNSVLLNSYKSNSWAESSTKCNTC